MSKHKEFNPTIHYYTNHQGENFVELFSYEIVKSELIRLQAQADKLAEALENFNKLLENEFGHKVCGPNDRCSDYGLVDSAKAMHQCYEVSKQALKAYIGEL